MADIADIAGEREEELRAQALRKQVGKSAPESHPRFNGTDCVKCDEPIPALRLGLGKVRCVPCQELLERNKRLGLG